MDNSELTISEKIRLFNGDGSWKTFSAQEKLPVITMSDGPHGLRKQEAESYADLNSSKVATCFPTACSIASSWNINSAAELGKAIAQEAKKEKVQLVLGPGINIKRSPLCGRNFEYYSEDPYLAGTMASAYISSMQKEGVGASLKHFAANNQEKRRQTSNSIIDERTLHEIYLRAFEITVKNASPVSIMASYNRLNGTYVCHHKELLTDILRDKWGFKGFVVSDWGACIDAPACIKAGMDLAMPDSNSYLSNSLKIAIADKIIQESSIDVANNRLIYWAENLNKNFESCEVDYSKQHKIALELAEDSAVLLKNEEEFFPLKTTPVFIAGELAEFMKFQGGGSSHITTAEYPNALESLEALGYKTVYSKAYYSGFCTQKKTPSKNRPLHQELAKKLKKEIIANPSMPVVFFCGLTEKYEGEGFDRTDLNLPKEQLEALNIILGITRNVAVVNFSGSPVSMPFAKDVKAILHMYLCGEACGQAVASLIAGKASPSGKLAETFPLCAEDTPCHTNFAPQSDNVEYREGVFTGYRYYSSKNKPVLFEFGFGLTYTKFEYSNLKVNYNGDRVKLTVDVANRGDFPASEIVQVYVKNPENPARPVKELRGFAKQFLIKGEKRTLEILLDDNAFKVYSNRTHQFEQISGEYEIQVCSSISDIRLCEKIVVNEGLSFEEAVSPVTEDFYTTARIVPHSKGNFTISDSLIDMSKTSFFIRCLLGILTFALQCMNKGKSKEDPSVKIAISAICENPLESLISTSGGAISEGFAKFLVKVANK